LEHVVLLEFKFADSKRSSCGAGLSPRYKRIMRGRSIEERILVVASPIFRDRRDPGRAFGAKLVSYAGADDLVVVATPELSHSVARLYGEFDQTTDEEVRTLLRRSAALPVPEKRRA
jgi:hypothetical protein